MIVYGKYKQKYVLSAKPISQDQDGAVYTVPGNPDIRVKIYRPEFRNSSMEKQVIDTANGTCSMLDEFPIDVVYANGRFAGYIFEDSAVEEAPAFDVPMPVPTQPGLPEALVTLITVGAAIVWTLLIYFVLFNVIAGAINEVYAFWNFKGIPMILGGWVLTIFALLKFRDQGNTTLIVSLVSFPVGAGILFGVVCLLVWLIALAFSLIEVILPTVIAIAIIVWLFKKFVLKR